MKCFKKRGREGKGATEVPDSILRPQLSPPPAQWGSSNRSTNTDAHRNKYSCTQKQIPRKRVAHRNKYRNVEINNYTIGQIMLNGVPTIDLDSFFQEKELDPLKFTLKAMCHQQYIY